MYCIIFLVVIISLSEKSEIQGQWVKNSNLEIQCWYPPVPT